MAEPNPDLDDFFAKKDRKKSKKKYPATDIGTTTVLSSAPPPPKPVINSTPQPENNNTKEDEVTTRVWLLLPGAFTNCCSLLLGQRMAGLQRGAGERLFRIEIATTHRTRT